MLNYTINKRNSASDDLNMSFDTYLIYDANDGTNSSVLIEFEPDKIDNMCYVGDRVSIITTNEIENDADTDGNIIDSQSLYTDVIGQNLNSNKFTIKAPKYRLLKLTSVSETTDDDGNGYIEFTFNDGHFYILNEEIKLIINLNSKTNTNIVLTDLEYVNCKVLSWKIDDSVTKYNELYSALFGDDSNLDLVYVRRPQNLFMYGGSRDTGSFINLTVNRPKLQLQIPIDNKISSDLNNQDIINNDFINNEISQVIPDFQEMEKVVYMPVIMNEDETSYTPVTKINFNLHFRYHGGDNWTVRNTDGWNFTRFGYNQTNDRYYSYNTKSNQSDLLGYLGFTNKDVINQKNKLQKSFLRLLFYDSINPANQNLITYSTIFFNTNKLYSKYIKCQNLTNWFLDESYPNNTFNHTGVSFELNKNLASIPTKIKKDDERIEEYRLSAQMSVQDKYSSKISSEGFYLYLWCDNKTVIPDHLYMKCEFNHAGYGRTIPMMAPYLIQDVDTIEDGRTNFFKTNDEIMNDWEVIGYGASRYNQYTYIKMKYVYDKDNNRYIYYIDPEYYGTLTGPTLNINLYEARIQY